MNISLCHWVMILALLLGLSSCTTYATNSEIPTTSNVLVKLSKENQVSSGYLISVTVSNKSQNKICLSNEILENVSSAGPVFMLKDEQGVRKPEFSSGFVPPPIPGYKEIEPDSTISFQYDIASYFDVKRNWFSRQKSFSLSAKIPLKQCGSQSSMLALSGWQKL